MDVLSAVAYAAAPTGTGKIGADPDRVTELSEAEAKEILARVMRTAQDAQRAYAAEHGLTNDR